MKAHDHLKKTAAYRFVCGGNTHRLGLTKGKNHPKSRG